MTKLSNQTLALAGMFQAVVLIDQLATSGEMDASAFDCSFASLFSFDAVSPVDVFGGTDGLTLGLETCVSYLSGNTGSSAKNIAYYVISILKLSRLVIKNHRLAEKIQGDLQKIQSQTSDFELSRSAMISKIDGLYQNTISTIKPRIIVQGEQGHLTNSDNAARIRSLLLAGIRSAVLWHQLGGSKWRLVFSRKKYSAAARDLLQSQ